MESPKSNASELFGFVNDVEHTALLMQVEYGTLRRMAIIFRIEGNQLDGLVDLDLCVNLLDGGPLVIDPMNDLLSQ